MRMRPATERDAEGMCRVLNPIIETGGTTAHEKTFDKERMIAEFIAPHRLVCCFLAEEDGQTLGFQSLEWCDPAWNGPGKLPEDWTVIATFVSGAARGKGVGAALFKATRSAAMHHGVTTIDATIRADNVLGLGYYSAMGFVDYDRIAGAPLSDGTMMDRIRKRFDFV